MTATKTAEPTGLALLRVPFPEHQIGKLPKQMKKDDNDKGKCERGTRYSADGHFCGGWHARSIHLDYVGHAALTDRFLDADPQWSWEPLAFGPDNMPAVDRNGGMWIKLTICGVTRLGYGDAQGKTGANAVKEVIGDALRNAGMRFGAALDLWHKGDLHDFKEAQGEETPPARPAEPTAPPEPPQDLLALIAQAKTTAELAAAGTQIATADLPAPAKSELRNQYNARMADLKAKP